MVNTAHEESYGVNDHGLAERHENGSGDGGHDRGHGYDYVAHDYYVAHAYLVPREALEQVVGRHQPEIADKMGTWEVL